MRKLHFTFLCCLLGFATSAAERQWPVDLTSAANADYTWNENSDVNKSGHERWGKTPGKVDFSGIAFQLAELRKHPGKTMLLLAGKQRRLKVPTELELSLPQNQARQLALLHAQSWPDAETFAEIIAVYADGSTHAVKLKGVETALDWLAADPLPNGRIAYRNPRQPAHGLYASLFHLPKPGPEKLRFRLASAHSVWMITAVTLLEKPVSFPEPVKITAGDEWIPMRFSSQTVPGSPLDFSGFIEAPAGKHGFLQTSPDGSFRFEKRLGSPVRFSGICLFRRANLPTHEQTIALTDELVRSGYNLIRIHCQDEFMCREGAKSSLELDPEALDRLEFLFAEAKKRGLYITIDLVGLRRFLAGDEIDDLSRFGIQRQFPISQAARDNIKEFARRWLTHVNPYTGLAWKDDPALVLINLVNEENITAWFWREPKAQAAYFSAWRKAKKLADNARVNRRDPEFVDFIYRMQCDALQEIAEYSRREIGLKTPFSILNFKEDPYLAPLRARYDYVDNHAYHDHPYFPGRTRFGFPYHHRQTSSVEEMGIYPIKMAPTRAFGKPMFLSEYSYAFPNRYRCEGGPLLGAYACLQDWDALACFAWTHYFDRLGFDHPVTAFSVYNDPIHAYSNRIISQLFLRRLVAPAAEAYGIPVPASVAEAARTMKSYTHEQNTLGLITQVGFIPEDSKLPRWNQTTGRVRELYEQALKTGRAVSSTGEIELDRNSKTFRVVTPRAICLTQHKGSAEAGPLNVSGVVKPQALALISLDDKPISDSGSLLLFHLTESANEGATFVDDSRRTMLAFGEAGKLLIRHAACEVRLAGKFRVIALGLNGEKKADIPVTYQNEESCFTLDNRAQNGTLVYNLIPVQSTNGKNTNDGRNDD